MLPEFSIIVPTYNRAFCIKAAIDSVLCQTYDRFEIIIVDDGSTDNTVELLNNSYIKQIQTGKIKVIQIQHSGVCKARNAGLNAATKDWIAYVDTDNAISKNFLAVYAKNIVENANVKSFYSKAHVIGTCRTIGKAFSLKSLIKGNFIDMGTYVHHRSLIDELGGFDENMTRLVDWELIVRQAKKQPPKFIDMTLLEYNNSKNIKRVSNTEDLKKNLDYFRKKHGK